MVWMLLSVVLISDSLIESTERRDRIIKDLTDALLAGQELQSELREQITLLHVSHQLQVIVFLRRSGLYEDFPILTRDFSVLD